MKRKDAVDFSAPSYFPKMIQAGSLNSTGTIYSLPFGGDPSKRLIAKLEKGIKQTADNDEEPVLPRKLASNSH